MTVTTRKLLYISACAVALLASAPTEAAAQCSTRFGVTTCKLHASLPTVGSQILHDFIPVKGSRFPTFSLVVERVVSDTCEIAGDPACEQCIWTLDISGQESRVIGGLSLGDARLDGQGVVQLNDNGEILIMDETLVNFRTLAECWIGVSVRYATDFRKIFP